MTKGEGGGQKSQKNDDVIFERPQKQWDSKKIYNTKSFCKKAKKDKTILTF